LTVLLFGATGTAGSGILAACLAAAEVAEVRAVVRRDPVVSHSKLTVVRHADYGDFGAIDGSFSGVTACFYALGRSVREVPGEDEYRRITHGFAMAAARQLRSASRSAVMHFVSGGGTRIDSRFMWARVKAETERDLSTMIPTVCWRPAFIDGGAAPTGPRFYRALRPAFRLLRGVRSMYVTSEDIGYAMVEATAADVRGGVFENPAIRDLADRYRARTARKIARQILI
jgi:uncharacterized protein YbjT (DUF2867 family)